MTAAALPSVEPAVLASDLVRLPIRLAGVVATDGARRGRVCVRIGRAFVRAEPGSAGPLLLRAAEADGGVAVSVHGPPTTPAEEADAALLAARGWVGAGDRPGTLAEAVGDHPLLRGLLRQLGEVRLSRLPRVGEAFGRSVIAQLVQGQEARRSVVQVAALAGTRVSATAASAGTPVSPHDLDAAAAKAATASPPTDVWTWPTASQLGATPAWALRRCGVSLRSAGALHAGAVHDAALTRAAAADDWPGLEARLRSLPGVGVWTAAETRLALGDPDATSVGDYHLPLLVCHVLADGARGPGRRREDASDAEMLALLAPYAGQRGRVIRLLERAAVRGLVSTPSRRGPRSALSAHRYW